MNYKNFALLITIFALLAYPSFAAEKLNEEMRLMMSWFEGRFDNFQQVSEEKESKAQYPHEHIHSIFARVNLPNLGENVFYVKQYMDGDASKVYRQRLYIFAPNKKEKAVELKIYTFPDEKAVVDAHLSPEKLNGLTLGTLKATPGCEVYWRLNEAGDKFLGTMKPNACRVESKRLNKTIIISDDLFLTKNEIWINDQARDEAGNYVFGNKSGVHHKLKKVRVFEGWTAVLKSGATEMSGEDAPADAWDGQRGISIHEGGQIVRVNDKFSVQLAQLVHKNGTPVLKLGVIENATGKTVSYTWTNPEAERIGINLRWLQAGFTLKK